MKNSNLTLMKNDAGHTNLGMLNKIFEFGKIQIRVELDEEGEPWFVANDICKALGLENSRRSINHHVYSEDVHQRYTLTNGGKQKINYVNEQGLYGLIFGSEKKEARAFKRFVCSKILPEIRKRGMYLSEEKEHQLVDLQKHFDLVKIELENLKAGHQNKNIKKNYIRNLISSCQSEDTESGKTHKFAGVQKIRYSLMTDEEKAAWNVQQLSRSGLGQYKKMLKTFVDNSCYDPETYRLVAETVEAAEKLKTHVSYDHLLPKTIETRDYDQKILLEVSIRENEYTERELFPNG